MRAAAIILSILFPGLGHGFAGQSAKGSILCFCSAFTLVLLLTFPSPWHEVVRAPFIAILGVLWLYAMIDIVRCPIDVDATEFAQEKDEHLRKGLMHYLRDELSLAKDEFREVLQFDRRDPDAQFHLAMTSKSEGLTKEAERQLRRCISQDNKQKWSWEIEKELQEIKESK